jgi:hypothetical protein
MATQLIELADGTLVEVEVSEKRARKISGGVRDKVEANFEKIRPILISICRPLSETWKEINRELEIEQAQIQLGLSFEGEGNLFVTKSKAGANLTVNLTLKPKG